MRKLPVPISKVRATVSTWTHDAVPVIVGAGFTNALGTIRSLGRKGIRSVIVDSNPNELAFQSRFAIPVLCQQYRSGARGFDEAGFVDDLLALGDAIRGAGKLPVLFITEAEDILPLLVRHLQAFASCFRLTSDIETAYRLEDKSLQLELAQRAGIAVPVTISVEDTTALPSICRTLPYPSLIKGRRGKHFFRRFGTQVFRVSSPDECVEMCRRCDGLEIIVQEEIPGSIEALRTFGSYFGSDSQPLGYFTGHKLRNSRSFGTCALGISAADPEVAETGLAFLREVRYHGASQIEFKRDARDGRLVYIEINNRLWKWHSLATACGVDLAYLQYLDAIGQPPAAATPVQVDGRRWWLPWMDLHIAWREIRRGELKLRDYLQDLSLDFVDGVGSWDDPLPGVLNFFRFKWRV